MKGNTELISRINQLMEQNADNANSFASKVGIDPGNFRKKLKGEYGVTKLQAQQDRQAIRHQG